MSALRFLKNFELKTLDRYLIRQFLMSYLICGTSILGLFILIEGLTRMDDFLKQDTSLPLVILQYFAATLPIYFSQYLGPVLTMVASLFSITMLNKGNELIPMKVSGISIQRILLPHFLMAGLSAFLMIGVQELVIPNFKDTIRTAFAYAKKSSIQPPRFPDSRGNEITVEEYFPQLKEGYGVRVDRFDADQNLVERIQAQRIIRVESDQGDWWRLENGTVQQWEGADGTPVANPDANGERGYVLQFKEYPLPTEMEPIDLESSNHDVPFLSYFELRDQHKRRENLSHLKVKLHLRFAFPLANFILLLLGLPFVLRRENQSVLIGIAVAIVVSAAYLFSTTICADLGNKGALAEEVAAWLPVLLFGALGITIFSDLD